MATRRDNTPTAEHGGPGRKEFDAQVSSILPTLTEISAPGYPRCECGMAIGPCHECPIWSEIWQYLFTGRLAEARRLLQEVLP